MPLRISDLILAESTAMWYQTIAAILLCIMVKGIQAIVQGTNSRMAQK
jgi:hypothetical protein